MERVDAFDNGGWKLQSFYYHSETILCFNKFSFHHKWNDAQLLLINKVYMNCLTSCPTT